MTAAGSPRTRFRRALRSGDARSVLLVASEVEALTLAEAFAVLLVLADADHRRYDRAAVRFHVRVCRELAPTIDDGLALLVALRALAPSPPAPRPREAGRDLPVVVADLVERMGGRGLAGEVAEWQIARARGGARHGP